MWQSGPMDKVLVDPESSKTFRIFVEGLLPMVLHVANKVIVYGFLWLAHVLQMHMIDKAIQV